MNNQPLVSIITPCYNGESFLHRYFGAILAQTYSNIELIFVNDGSTDKTEEIALSYKDKLEAKGVKFIYMYQDNAGQAAAVNSALKVFSGEYLTWPDSDDWMPFNMIEKQVEYLKKNPHKGFVLNKCQYINDEDTKTVLYTRERKNKENGYLFEDFIKGNDIYWCAGAVMVKTDCFLKSNPIRDIFTGTGGQNWQMLLPISYEYECGFLNEPVYNILRRNNSHSRSITNAEDAYEYSFKQEDTVLQTISRMNISNEEKNKYMRIAKYEQTKKRFYLAIEFFDTNNLKIAYNEVALYGKISLKMCLQYHIFKHPVLRKIYNIIR